MPVAESATRKADKAGRSGARAGAKARERQSLENDAAITAAVKASKTGKATSWSYGYRAGTLEDGTADHRTVTVWERARREVTAADLLSRCNAAARQAAARVAVKHGVPAPSWDEISDTAQELCTRLLGECHPGQLPTPDRLNSKYLAERAKGLLMDDPNRQVAGVGEGADAADLLGAADTVARAKGARRDAMLTVPGEQVSRLRHGRREVATVPDDMDPVNPSLRAGLAACELSAKPSRAAAYLVHGGTVAGDWAKCWKVADGYAKTRTVPEGVNALRTMPTQDWADLAGAIATAAAPDRQDRREARRREIERGLCPPSDRARAVKPWRDRETVGDRVGRIGPMVAEHPVRVSTVKPSPVPMVKGRTLDRDLADAELAETRKRRNRNQARRITAAGPRFR